MCLKASVRTRGQTPPRFAPPSSKRTSPDSVEARSSHKRRAERRDITTAAQMDEEITNQKTTNAPAKACGWLSIMPAPTQYLSPNFNGADPTSPFTCPHCQSKVSSDIIETLRLAKKDAEKRMEQGNLLKPGERLEITTAEIDGFAVPDFEGVASSFAEGDIEALTTTRDRHRHNYIIRHSAVGKHPALQSELGEQAWETSPVICAPEAKDNSPEFDQSQRSEPRSAESTIIWRTKVRKSMNLNGASPRVVPYPLLGAAAQDIPSPRPRTTLMMVGRRARAKHARRSASWPRE
ncbi:hypothetical protein FCIRC_10050 [Fusarium circinatum]|uniref:Uncharacterized protein n=1 Tax=Fusarium circinatum TaxID=48490 RepID=A0A8H5WQX0_FUSCI|nr:hypothetical protein FCIRC_10050 [Fusarium circinatum]